MALDPSRLKSIALFESLSDQDLRAIAAFAEEVRVPEGEPLVKEGQFSYEFFAIEEGSAEVLRGGEHVADLGAGDFFGEIGLLERELRTATVVAKSDMRLITLTGWDMKRMEKQMPEVVEELRRVLEQRKPPEDG
jgi:CRP-like cAMP-binding protein